MGALGVSDRCWIELLTAASATCWLFPEHPALDGLRTAMNKVEMEAPDLVLRILEIAENNYNALDTDMRHRVDSYREHFR